MQRMRIKIVVIGRTSSTLFSQLLAAQSALATSGDFLSGPIKMAEVGLYHEIGIVQQLNMQFIFISISVVEFVFQNVQN